MMPPGIELYIARELGANAYKIGVYKHGMFCGWLIGYVDYRSKTVKCYPFRRLMRGTFAKNELPVCCAIGELPWERRA